MGNALKKKGKLEGAIKAFKKGPIEPDNKKVSYASFPLTGEKTETAPREYLKTYLMTMLKNLKPPSWINYNIKFQN